jgi:hypothetical protein
VQLVSQPTLIAKARVEADLENSDVITDTQIGDWLNDEARALQNLLLRHKGQGYYALRAPPFSTAAGVSEYTLPADFFELLAVRARAVGATAGANDRILDPCDAPFFAGLASPARGTPTHYMLRGMFAIDGATTARETIEFFPTPNGVESIILDYVPAFQVVSSGTVSYNGINGWEMFMVYGVAARLIHKAKRDPSFVLSLQQRIQKDIEDLSAKRDRRPAVMVDVYGHDASLRGPWWSR